MRVGSKISATVAVAMAAATLAACSSSNDSGGSSSGDYVIGYSNGLTGPTAAFGAPGAKMVQAVFDSINNAGGINGHKIKLVTLDQGKPGSGQASANVTQLITQDQAIAVLGQSISNDCASVESIATKYKVPLLCERVPAADLRPAKKYVFIDTSSEVAEVQPQIAMIKKLLPNKPNPRVAIIGNDNIGTNTWAAAAQKAVQDMGGTVATYQNMSESATTVSPNTAAIVASQPDIVLGEIFQQFWTPLINGMRSAGSKAPMIATSGDIFYSDLVSLKDPDVYHTSMAAPLDPATTNPDQKQLIAALNALGVSSANDLNSGEGSQIAVAPYILAAALAKCGNSCNGESLATALESATTTAAGLVPAGFGYTPDLHFGVKQYDFFHWDPTKNALVSGGTEPAGDPVTGAAHS